MNEDDWRKGVEKPEDYKQYQARDGLYYNGYIGSTDFIEDVDEHIWKPFRDQICKEIEKELNDPTLWDKDGTRNSKKQQE